MYKLDMRKMKKLEVYDLNQPLSPFAVDGARTGLIDSFKEYRKRIWATGNVWIQKGDGWVRYQLDIGKEEGEWRMQNI